MESFSGASVIQCCQAAPAIRTSSSLPDVTIRMNKTHERIPTKVKGKAARCIAGAIALTRLPESLLLDVAAAVDQAELRSYAYVCCEFRLAATACLA